MQNNILFLTLLGLLLTSISLQVSFAQETIDTSKIQYNLWSDGSPQTLIPNRKVWPLFGIKKMGAARNMEWQIQPLFFFVSPNLGLKKHWKKNKKGLHFSSLHKINYPSIYLKLIAREGAGGVLPKDSNIPPIISITNEFLLGFNSQGNFITLRGGIVTAFTLGAAEKNFPDIDFPFLYNRTLAFNNSPNIYMGVNFHRDIFLKLNMEIDFTAFKVDNNSNHFVFESKLIFFWKKSDKFGLKGGIATAHGRYPYGSDFRMIPVFDVIFGFGRNKKEG